MRLIVLRVERDEDADAVARLVAATLAMNGYNAGRPYVIDTEQLHAELPQQEVDHG